MIQIRLEPNISKTNGDRRSVPVDHQLEMAYRPRPYPQGCSIQVRSDKNGAKNFSADYSLKPKSRPKHCRTRYVMKISNSVDVVFAA